METVTAEKPVVAPSNDQPSDPFDRADLAVADEKPEEVAPIDAADDEAEEPVEEKAEETEDQKADEEPQSKKQVNKVPLQQLRRFIRDNVQEKQMQDALLQSVELASALNKSNVRLGMLKKVARTTPTEDVYDHVVSTAAIAQELGDALASGTPQGIVKFEQALYNQNPAAWDKRYDFLTAPETIKRLAPKKMEGLAKYTLREVIAAGRKAGDQYEAIRSGKVSKEDVETAVGVISDWLELNDDEPRQPKPAQDDPRERELQELRRRETERVQQSYNQFVAGIYSTAGETLADDISAFIDERGGAYNMGEKAKQELFRRIADPLYKAVTSNSFIKKQVEAMIRSGDGSEEHRMKVASWVVNQAKALAPEIREQAFKEFREMFGLARRPKEEKLQRHLQHRDVGTSGGKPVAPVVQKPKGTPSADDLFDWADRS